MSEDLSPAPSEAAKFSTIATPTSAQAGVSMLDAALGYAVRGLRVHPLWWISPTTGACACSARGDCRSPGKHPITKWAAEATTDEAAIRAWWKRRPLAGIGLVTGALNGFIVVDIDAELGEASWCALEAEHGPVGPTVTAITGRGRHLFFVVGEHHELRNKMGLVPGIDVRAGGGYVACAPTMHIVGRRYMWLPGHGLDATMAPLPGWVAVLARSAKAKGGAV